MPVVPKVYVDGARASGDEHQDVDAKAHGDDERPHRARIGDGGRGRPAEVEVREVEMVKLRHAFQGGSEARRQKRGDDAKPHEPDADEQSGFERLGKLDSEENAENGEDGRHHHRRAKPDHVCENFFHPRFSLQYAKCRQ